MRVTMLDCAINVRRGMSKVDISLYLCRHSGVKDALNTSVLIPEALIYWLHIKVVRFCPLVKALPLWSRVRIYVDR